MAAIEYCIPGLLSSKLRDTMAISSADPPIQDNNGGSDSDTDPGDAFDYYQPILADDGEDSGFETNLLNSDEDHTSICESGILPSGHYVHQAVNGVRSLRLNGDPDEEKNSSSDDEEETSETAIWTAFREDESRRSVPLTVENAIRVREAMREVSFGGVTLDWAGAVAEDQWINQLWRLRQNRQLTTNHVS